ncbi:MAG: T9SS type A sorting domain-containing protein [Bacteroidetes bacterium]|nr:MAG: T9SS type A sorting domain-containing protein [Bacteroidota bacterium]
MPTVITGSHNWSSSAEEDNDENTLIIKDISIANQFMQEFKKRYNDAGGTGSFIIPSDVINENNNSTINFELNQNFPNPFNPVTTINFQVHVKSFVSLKIFDILGREVAKLVNEEKQQGKYSVEFNGSKLSSGVYLYELKAGYFRSVKKMTMMK